MSNENLIEKYKTAWKSSCKFKGKVVCADCKAYYGSFQDMLISDELWEKITPADDKKGGILCPTCIANRLDYLGLWYKDNVFMQKTYYDEIISMLQRRLND